MTSASTVPPGRRPSGRGPREWARAFTGFYPPLAEELADLDPIARFLYSARSVILVISFQAALLAGLLALTDRRFELVPFLLVVLGYAVLHAISNLSNDYFGARRGHDTDDSPRRRYTVHPLLSGAVSSRLLVRVRVMSAPAPDAPPPGYVGWPLWYHRVCLVHNRAFGWLYVLGLAAGAVVPGLGRRA